MADFYNNPIFKVIHEDGESEFKKQNTGIRQGCPLSPYLSTLVTTVMFHDIHKEVDHKLNGLLTGRVDGLDYSEILYADDTMLALKDTKSANTLLQAIER